MFSKLNFNLVKLTGQADVFVWSDPAQFDIWRIGLRRKVLTHLTEFVTGRYAAEAFERLKQMSQDRNTPIAQVAQRVTGGDRSLVK
jgi:hypothetical protein